MIRACIPLSRNHSPIAQPVNGARYCSGAGSEARQSIGWVIFGGLGISGLFTLFLTPVIYLAVARFGQPRSVDLARLREEIDQVDEDMTVAPA